MSEWECHFKIAIDDELLDRKFSHIGEIEDYLEEKEIDIERVICYEYHWVEPQKGYWSEEAFSL